MNNSRVDGMNREAQKNNPSTGISPMPLFLLLQRLGTNRPGDNQQRGTLQ